MKKYGPLATLVAVVLLGAVVLVANMTSTPSPTRNAAAPVVASANTPAQAAPPASAEPAPAEPAAAA
ncbi:MAG: hypothetical protein QOK35_1911, partial [Pseudonocardiales bacterium]|nr:hypothetical protein [Pseudonocardiales bacterium]